VPSEVEVFLHPFTAAAEKRIKRIVYCGDQLFTKRSVVWERRYDRAMKEAQTIEEMDEAMLRLNRLHPSLGLDKVVRDHQATR
jgi:hypothetical protein